MLLRKGRFPADVRAELDRERLVLIAEGVPGTISRRSGGRQAAPRRSGTVGALAITQQRLVIFVMGEPLIDVTWDSGDAGELDVAAQDTGLKIAFDAERFADDRSGPVELVLRIADSATLLAAIDQRRRPLEPRRRA